MLKIKATGLRENKVFFKKMFLYLSAIPRDDMISNEKKSMNSLLFVTSGQFLLYKKCYIFQERISQMETVEISLTCTGCDLRQVLAEKVGLPAHHLKMICRGQVVSMTKSLQEQNVKV